MKKNIELLCLIVLLMCVIPFIAGCSKTKNITYKGKKINVDFTVLKSSRYHLSEDSRDFKYDREKAIIIGKHFDIGIEEDETIAYKRYGGDFNKLKDNFKGENEFKEVTYNGKDSFQKYYGSYIREEVYLKVNEKVSLKLNIYSHDNNKKTILEFMKSKEAQDILNSIVVTEK